MDKTPSRVKIIIAIIGAVAVIAAAIIGSPFLSNLTGKSGNEQQESQIAVRVANENGESVSRANVLLFFPGGPLSNYTDVNGTTSTLRRK